MQRIVAAFLAALLLFPAGSVAQGLKIDGDRPIAQGLVHRVREELRLCLLRTKCCGGGTGGRAVDDETVAGSILA